MADTPHVLVVGGGITGCGVARDLAMRGADVTLVERDTIASGTTGHMHGLLHSGGRYAVADPDGATDCIAENRTLRSIAGHCIEDTGGLFVSLPEDDDDYFEAKVEGCADCGIPADVLTGREARAQEPALAESVERAVSVPDGAVDPYLLTIATAVGAVDHGAEIRTDTAVTDLVVEDEATSGREVVGVEVDGDERLDADHVVNAAGAWAGRVAALADVDVEMRPSKGVMTVVDYDGVRSVLNRCRPKGNGDIVVPLGETAVLGTTDEEVDDPETYPREQWEEDLLFEELSPVVPALSDAPVTRSYWGVRPLYEPPAGDAGPLDLTRGFSVLDHADRDGVTGFTSIVGGKLTTHRLMAEETVDHVCDRLGVAADCRTATEPLPGHDDTERVADALAAYGLDGAAPWETGR
jgi:glycerol-3-phosphate dehydrogenase